MSRQILATALAFLLLATLTLSTRAADATPKTEMEMLKAAYKTLAIADHDYKGHRAKAMREIEAACDKMGSDVRGEGKGHEKQAVSDDQLREAKKFLEDARDHLAARHEDFVAHHIDLAAKELAIALTLK